MKFSFSILSGLTVFIMSQAAHALPFSPLALIYKGEGSCSEESEDAGSHGYGCSDAAAVVARKAGFRVKFVKPDTLMETATDVEVADLFKNAKVWIQPGGYAVNAFQEMSSKLTAAVVDFVNDGGGYVGWCAGALVATAKIGESHYPGFGIFPGNTNLFAADGETSEVKFSFQKINWKGKDRYIYFEGGPSLAGFEDAPGAETIGLYENGEVAAARAPYGKGRVFISGPHPEAPAVWSEEEHIHDPDGSDRDLAVDMVQWAANLSRRPTSHHAGE